MNESNKENSAEYEAASAAANEAAKIFRVAQLAFRSMQIDADAFFAAKAIHDDAQAAFDVAYAREVAA